MPKSKKTPMRIQHFPEDLTPLSLMQQGSDDGHAEWPPVVTHSENLGYIQSSEQPFYSHDIGRTFTLAGRIYKLNGDTFCNDAGISSNTYQIIPNPGKPTEALFLNTKPNGYVEPLIRMEEEEEQYLNLPQHKHKRMAFWCFGGVVEISPGVGWTWYEKTVINMNDHSHEVIGVGLARISHNRDRPSGELSCVRMPGMMFPIGDPLFGSFSTLIHNGTVYLWGQQDRKVFLARVSKENCQHRHYYQYWNGNEYTSDMTKATPVLEDYQHGQVFRSNMFGPRFSWLFIGCTRFGDSKVMMGAASRLEGPWELYPVVSTNGIRDTANYRYCMYPHPWASKVSERELLVTWCDHWPGGVIAARIRFARGGRTDWADIPLYGLSSRVIRAVFMKAAETCASQPLRYEQLTAPLRLRIRGVEQRTVDWAVNMIRHTIAIGKKEELDEMEVAATRARRPSLRKRIVARVLDCACGQL